MISYFSRKDTESLRQELMQVRMQRCEATDQLRDAREELAKWRFQCLKAKCVLIDREMRLEANNIAFEPSRAVPVNEAIEVSVEEDFMDNRRHTDDCQQIGRGEEEHQQHSEIEETFEEATVVTDVVVEETGASSSPGDCEIVEEANAEVIDLVNSSVVMISTNVVQVKMEETEAIAEIHPIIKTEVVEVPVVKEEEKEGTSKEPHPVTTSKKVPSNGFESLEQLFNFDFLLSPKHKPQGLKATGTPVEVVNLVDVETGDEGENKENVSTIKTENQQQLIPPTKKKGCISKLSYKAINMNPTPKNPIAKNVHFGTDSTESESKVKGGNNGNPVGAVFLRQDLKAAAEPKKKFKVNFRRVHSKPTTGEVVVAEDKK